MQSKQSLYGVYSLFCLLLEGATMPKDESFLLAEEKQNLERDTLSLARLIYDIYVELRRKNGDTIQPTKNVNGKDGRDEQQG